MTDIVERLTAALADRYAIERELGAGGMATVYLAHDVKHNRKVAVKVLKPELSAVIGGDRFVQEIEVTANLQHPNILPLYDSGTAQAADGQATFLYYVMPFIDGESLRDRLERERQLPVDESVAIARSVAAALDYAHRHAVVHRDIKPENILLHDGQALVADFGIALAVSAAGGQRMTETGMSVGTPHYMSPEQASADRELDGRTDVYSLGATLYEMLAGEPPFGGASAQAIVAKILTEPPPPVSKERASVPPHVEAALQRSMAKLPADRFQSAAEFGAALGDTAFSTVMTGAAPTVGGAGRWWLTPALAVALLVMTIVAVLGWRGREAPSPVYRVGVAFNRDQRVQRVPTRRFAVSRDGQRIAYIGPGSGGGVRGIWIRELDQLDARPLPGTDLPRAVFFSPDGQSVGFVDGEPGNLKTVSIDGGPVRVLVPNVNPWGGAWGEDGWIYLSMNAGQLGRVRASGGIIDTLVAPDSAEVVAGLEYDWPEPLPGGDALLFQIWRGTIASTDLAVMRLDTREIRVLVNAVQGEYLHPGLFAYLTFDGTLMVQRFDLDRLELVGDPVPVESGIRIESFAGVGQLDVSDDGTLFYQQGGLGSDDQIVRVDREGAAVAVDPAWRSSFQNLSLSPDGSLLAVAQVDASGSHIWVKELDTGPARLMTFDGTGNTRPVWMPDGSHVLYFDGEQRLWRARADGGAAAQQVATPVASWEAEWSQDGTWLVLRTGGTGTGTRDVVAVRPGRDSLSVTIAGGEADEYAPALAPNGRWVAYVSTETGREEIYVRPFPDADRTKIRVSVQGGTEPRWARDGRELFYRNARGEMVVHAVREDGVALRLETAEVLFDAAGYLSENYHRTYDVTPDGRFMMVAPAEGSGGDLVIVVNWAAEIRARLDQ